MHVLEIRPEGASNCTAAFNEVKHGLGLGRLVRGVRVIPVGQGAVHGILGVECHAGERKEEAEQQYKQNRIHDKERSFASGVQVLLWVIHSYAVMVQMLK